MALPLPADNSSPDEAIASALRTLEAAAERVTRELTDLRVTAGPELATVKHGVTRWSITLTVLEAERAGGEFTPGEYAAGEWLTAAGWAALPVSAPQRKLADTLAKPRQRGLF